MIVDRIQKVSITLSLVGGCLLVGALAGCSGGPSQPTGDEATARAALAGLGLKYGEYLNSHNGAAPADEAALRAHLESRMSELKGYGIKSPDDLLKSHRDGQPMTIVVGKTIPVPDMAGVFVAAYEQTGVGAKKLICNTRGGVFDLPAQEVAAQVSGK